MNDSQPVSKKGTLPINQTPPENEVAPVRMVEVSGFTRELIPLHDRLPCTNCLDRLGKFRYGNQDGREMSEDMFCGLDCYEEWQSKKVYGDGYRLYAALFLLADSTLPHIRYVIADSMHAAYERAEGMGVENRDKMVGVSEVPREMIKEVGKRRGWDR